MPFLGYLAAAFIGLSLGLIGGGGSILTIPVLVYLFGISPSVATGYSLFIVGSTSFAGALNNYKKGQVNIAIAAYFGSASILTVFITRKYLIGLIPDHLFWMGDIECTKSLAIMTLFAVLMIIAALKMIFNSNVENPKQNIETPKLAAIIAIGITIGLITGLLGAGGGFLIIPVLIYFFHLPMKQAIGTSLLIIALNSLIGFLGDIMNETINWHLLLGITSISICGVFAGSKISNKVNANTLRRMFGLFIFAVGVYILSKEFFIV